MTDDRTDEQKNEEFAGLSENLKTASMDLRESINELSAYYTQLGTATNPLEWLRAIDRCERSAVIVSEKFAALKLAILSEPYKP
jgi:hypothetical protein